MRADKRIPVTEETWRMLHDLKQAGQTHDELIRELIDEYDNETGTMNEYDHTFEIEGRGTETIRTEGPKGHALPDESELAERFDAEPDEVTWVLSEERGGTGEMQKAGAIPCVECHSPVWSSATRARQQYETDFGYWKCGDCAREEKS